MRLLKHFDRIFEYLVACGNAGMFELAFDFFENKQEYKPTMVYESANAERSIFHQLPPTN
jgi:hypothetical protein